MNRRHFIKSSVAVSLGTAALFTKALKADEVTNQSVVFDTIIANNHSHDLELTITSVVQAIQKAKKENSVKFDIQGMSGHNHTISLTLENLVQLLTDSTLSTMSSDFYGHRHEVTFKLRFE